jgi:hypothetical protein
MGAYYFLLSVRVSPQVKQEFQKLKTGNFSFMVCNFSKDNSEIIVEKVDYVRDWDYFQMQLPEDEVRIHE